MVARTSAFGLLVSITCVGSPLSCSPAEYSHGDLRRVSISASEEDASSVSSGSSRGAHEYGSNPGDAAGEKSDASSPSGPKLAVASEEVSESPDPDCVCSVGTSELGRQVEGLASAVISLREQVELGGAQDDWSAREVAYAISAMIAACGLVFGLRMQRRLKRADVSLEYQRRYDQLVYIDRLKIEKRWNSAGKNATRQSFVKGDAEAYYRRFWTLQHYEYTLWRAGFLPTDTFVYWATRRKEEIDANEALASVSYVKELDRAVKGYQGTDFSEFLRMLREDGVAAAIRAHKPGWFPPVLLVALIRSKHAAREDRKVMRRCEELLQNLSPDDTRNVSSCLEGLRGRLSG